MARTEQERCGCVTGLWSLFRPKKAHKGDNKVQAQAVSGEAMDAAALKLKELRREVKIVLEAIRQEQGHKEPIKPIRLEQEEDKHQDEEENQEKKAKQLKEEDPMKPTKPIKLEQEENNKENQEKKLKKEEQEKKAEQVNEEEKEADQMKPMKLEQEEENEAEKQLKEEEQEKKAEQLNEEEQEKPNEEEKEADQTKELRREVKQEQGHKEQSQLEREEKNQPNQPIKPIKPMKQELEQEEQQRMKPMQQQLEQEEEQTIKPIKQPLEREEDQMKQQKNDKPKQEEQRPKPIRLPAGGRRPGSRPKMVRFSSSAEDILPDGTRRRSETHLSDGRGGYVEFAYLEAFHKANRWLNQRGKTEKKIRSLEEEKYEETEEEDEEKSWSVSALRILIRLTEQLYEELNGKSSDRERIKRARKMMRLQKMLDRIPSERKPWKKLQSGEVVFVKVAKELYDRAGRDFVAEFKRRQVSLIYLPDSRWPFANNFRVCCRELDLLQRLLRGTTLYSVWNKEVSILSAFQSTEMRQELLLRLVSAGANSKTTRPWVYLKREHEQTVLSTSKKREMKLRAREVGCKDWSTRGQCSDSSIGEANSRESNPEVGAASQISKKAEKSITLWRTSASKHARDQPPHNGSSWATLYSVWSKEGSILSAFQWTEMIQERLLRSSQGIMADGVESAARGRTRRGARREEASLEKQDEEDKPRRTDKRAHGAPSSRGLTDQMDATCDKKEHRKEIFGAVRDGGRDEAAEAVESGGGRPCLGAVGQPGSGSGAESIKRRRENSEMNEKMRCRDGSRQISLVDGNGRRASMLSRIALTGAWMIEDDDGKMISNSKKLLVAVEPEVRIHKDRRPSLRD
ncbi:hypothetical protein SELMODRAFT_408209 [Selaginella moellendorffii]|uniref:Uncharacterized protein n=1 Tax=Selaginella moellendorffii TaxID=88036 RepID=D8R7J6_SELML|nr:hypothetical protein SELMODRAFT_408209 [Selaginella moellendorffii]